jgi:hypothetical protein
VGHGARVSAKQALLSSAGSKKEVESDRARAISSA